MRTTHEKLAEMKQEQKALTYERRYNNVLRKEYDSQIAIWRDEEPAEVMTHLKKICDLHHEHWEPNPLYSDYAAKKTEWQSKKPQQLDLLKRAENKDYVRHFNVIYGMAKGRSYKSIEAKTREDNPISHWVISELLKKWDLVKTDFYLDNGELQ